MGKKVRRKLDERIEAKVPEPEAKEAEETDAETEEDPAFDADAHEKREGEQVSATSRFEREEREGRSPE